jgi:hypothetical protein
LHRTKELHIFTIMRFVALQLPFFCIFLQEFMIAHSLPDQSRRK